MSSPQKISEQEYEELITFVNEILKEQQQQQEQCQVIISASDEKNSPPIQREVCFQTDPDTIGEIDSLIGNFEQMTVNKSLFEQIEFFGGCACFKLCEIFSGNQEPLTLLSRIKMDKLREELNKQIRETIFRQNRKNYIHQLDKQSDKSCFEQTQQQQQCQDQQQDNINTHKENISTFDDVDTFPNAIKSKAKVVKKRRKQSHIPYC
ncbi:unnamed protein product [Paramecium primaurelia]|uniref:Uncharacterized protein n=1 Tax=Paramecium primaurelia TaxID=5886 RepID=A0A8S1PQD7_PARPR|nr:unnamed protein product [Paramecium primaurelia]